MEAVGLSIDAGIATITFNNPPKGFLTSEMLMTLGQHLDQIEGDDNARAVILTGGMPDVFIRHFAVEEILAMSEALQAQQAKGLPTPRFSRAPLRGVWERLGASGRNRYLDRAGIHFASIWEHLGASARNRYF